MARWYGEAYVRQHFWENGLMVAVPAASGDNCAIILFVSAASGGNVAMIFVVPAASEANLTTLPRDRLLFVWTDKSGEG